MATAGMILAPRRTGKDSAGVLARLEVTIATQDRVAVPGWLGDVPASGRCLPCAWYLLE